MMPKKARSEIYLTFPTLTAEGDEVIDINRSKRTTRASRSTE